MKIKRKSLKVDEDFFWAFEKMRIKKQKELGLINLGQVSFSRMLFKGKAIIYPKYKNAKKKR